MLDLALALNSKIISEKENLQKSFPRYATPSSRPSESDDLNVFRLSNYFCYVFC
jgi:hypothetical protein